MRKAVVDLIEDRDACAQVGQNQGTCCRGGVKQASEAQMDVVAFDLIGGVPSGRWGVHLWVPTFPWVDPIAESRLSARHGRRKTLPKRVRRIGLANDEVPPHARSLSRISRTAASRVSSAPLPAPVFALMRRRYVSTVWLDMPIRCAVWAYVNPVEKYRRASPSRGESSSSRLACGLKFRVSLEVEAPLAGRLIRGRQSVSVTAGSGDLVVRWSGEGIEDAGGKMVLAPCSSRIRPCWVTSASTWIWATAKGGVSVSKPPTMGSLSPSREVNAPGRAMIKAEVGLLNHSANVVSPAV